MTTGNLSELAHQKTPPQGKTDPPAGQEEAKADPAVKAEAVKVFHRIQAEDPSFGPDGYFKLAGQHTSPAGRRAVDEAYREVFSKEPPRAAPELEPIPPVKGGQEEPGEEKDGKDGKEKGKDGKEKGKGKDGVDDAGPGGPIQEGKEPRGGAPGGAGGAGGAGGFAPFVELLGGELKDYAEEKSFHDAWKVRAKEGAAAPEPLSGDRAALVAAAMGRGGGKGFVDGVSALVIDTALNKATSKIPYAAGFIAMFRVGKGIAQGKGVGGAVSEVLGVQGIADNFKEAGQLWSGGWIDKFEAIINILDGVNGIIGALSTICMVVAAASFIIGLFFPALLPFAALAAKWGLLLGTVNTLIGFGITALRFLCMNFRAMKLLKMEGDPEAIAKEAAKLENMTQKWATGFTQQKGNQLRARMQNGPAPKATTPAPGGGQGNAGGAQARVQSLRSRVLNVGAQVATGGMAGQLKSGAGDVVTAGRSTWATQKAWSSSRGELAADRAAAMQKASDAAGSQDRLFSEGATRLMQRQKDVVEGKASVDGATQGKAQALEGRGTSQEQLEQARARQKAAEEAAAKEIQGHEQKLRQAQLDEAAIQERLSRAKEARSAAHARDRRYPKKGNPTSENTREAQRRVSSAESQALEAQKKIAAVQEQLAASQERLARIQQGESRTGAEAKKAQERLTQAEQDLKQAREVLQRAEQNLQKAQHADSLRGRFKDLLSTSGQAIANTKNDLFNRQNLDGGDSRSLPAAGYGHQGTGGATGAGTDPLRSTLADQITGGTSGFSAGAVLHAVTGADVGADGKKTAGDAYLERQQRVMQLFDGVTSQLKPPPLESEGELDAAFNQRQKTLAELEALRARAPLIEEARRTGAEQVDGLETASNQITGAETNRVNTIDKKLTEKSAKQAQLKAKNDESATRGDEVQQRSGPMIGTVGSFVSKFIQLCELAPKRVLGSRGASGIQGARKLQSGVDGLSDAGAVSTQNKVAIQADLTQMGEVTAATQEKSALAGGQLQQLQADTLTSKNEATLGLGEVEQVDVDLKNRIATLEAQQLAQEQTYHTARARMSGWAAEHRQTRLAAEAALEGQLS